MNCLSHKIQTQKFNPLSLCQIQWFFPSLKVEYTYLLLPIVRLLTASVLVKCTPYHYFQTKAFLFSLYTCIKPLNLYVSYTTLGSQSWIIGSYKHFSNYIIDKFIIPYTENHYYDLDIRRSTNYFSDLRLISRASLTFLLNSRVVSVVWLLYLPELLTYPK